MVPKPEPDAGIGPEFWAAVERCRERYNAKVSEDRRARLNDALARFDAAVDDFITVHNDLTAAAGTMPEAAEQFIRKSTADLGDAKFFRWRLAAQPKPAIAPSLRNRADATQRKMWRALFEAVTIDKTLLGRQDIVDMMNSYQTIGKTDFFEGLGAAVAQLGGLHGSTDIDAAILAFAGRELGYSYSKIARIIDELLDRQDTDSHAVQELLRRHRRLIKAEVKA